MEAHPKIPKEFQNMHYYPIHKSANYVINIFIFGKVI